VASTDRERAAATPADQRAAAAATEPTNADREAYKAKLRSIGIGKTGVKGTTKQTVDRHDWGTATVTEHWDGNRQDVTITPNPVGAKAAPGRAG
jgi:hypothetical protein